MIKALTLDAAGTLIYPRENVGTSYCRIAAEFGALLDASALAQAFKSVFADMPPMACDASDAADLDAQERDWWRHLVRQVTNRAGGIKAFDAYFDRLYAYFAQPNAWGLYDEVLPLLQTLRARGISSAVVSNFDSRLLPILQGLGVSELVGGVVYSTAANSAKPDAGIFRQATALLDLPAAHCLHLGDHPIADYQGARAAGLQALLVHRGAPDQMPATDCITNLSEALARFQN